jgi:tRNA(fMet)-specific endonuclease VapC
VIRYVLDTDTFTAFFYESIKQPDTAPITTRIAALGPGAVSVTIVTVTETMRGMLNLLQRMEKVGKDAQGFADFERAYQTLRRFPVVSFTSEAQDYFSAFTPAIRRIGRPDCQIAAIALAGEFIVVTANTKHFAQIPGVVYEDWTRQSSDVTLEASTSD